MFKPRRSCVGKTRALGKRTLPRGNARRMFDTVAVKVVAVRQWPLGRRATIAGEGAIRIMLASQSLPRPRTPCLRHGRNLSSQPGVTLTLKCGYSVRRSRR